MMNEQAVVNKAYVCIDEIDLLPAPELSRQLRMFQQLNEQLESLHADAKDVIKAAVRFYGLNPHFSPGAGAGFVFASAALK